MASGPPSSTSPGLIFYQTPPIEPPLVDGDVVVTRGPYTIPPLPHESDIHVQVGLGGRTVVAWGSSSHPLLPSEMLTTMCGGGLGTLCDLKETPLGTLLDSMGSNSCLLQKTIVLLLSFSGIEHPLTGKAVNFASLLKEIVEGLSNACSENFRREMINMLNNCLEELLEMTSEIMVLMGKQLLENRRQELEQQTTRR